MKTQKALQEATFAMGCFWCGAVVFTDHETNEKLPGIVSITVGYAGGTSTHPTYADHAGHKETVKVIFDPEKISYDKLLTLFWHNIDPFDDKGQFCDKGFAYTAVIFYNGEEQQKLAMRSKMQVEEKLKREVVTELTPATVFYDAEDYHQDYKIKNPVHYQYYRCGCGRDARLKEIWGA
jgi:peptide-methionine (S)-S-oxide reductase